MKNGYGKWRETPPTRATVQSDRTTLAGLGYNAQLGRASSGFFGLNPPGRPLEGPFLPPALGIYITPTTS